MKLKRILLGLIALGVVYATVTFGLILSGTRQTPEADADTMLILGTQVKGTKEKPYPSAVLRERLDTALPYLKESPKTIVIVCGGQGADEPISEAQMMADYLIDHGIPAAQIIEESSSTRTKENLQNAEVKRTLGQTVIVTSDFHLYRAELLAKRLGLKNISGLPAVSKSSALFKTYFREVFALGYGILFDW